jgi:hypothetical protein
MRLGNDCVTWHVCTALLVLLLQLQDRTAELTLQVQQYSRQMEEALARMARLQEQ